MPDLYSRRSRLANLLVEILGDELDEFVVKNHPDLLKHLPDRSTPAARAGALVGKLVQRNEINAAFFEGLRSERPLQAGRIAVEQRLWQSQQDHDVAIVTMRVVPPAARVAVEYSLDGSSTFTPLNKHGTDISGWIRDVPIPSGSLMFRAKSTDSPAVTIGPISITAGHHEVVTLRLQSAPFYVDLFAPLYSLSRRALFASIATLVALGGLSVAAAPLVTPGPTNAMFVGPACLRTGVVPNTDSNKLSAMLLGMAADMLKENIYKQTYILDSLFSNPPTGNGVPIANDFWLETTEVATLRYWQWLKKLDPAEREAMTPQGWDSQLDAAWNEYRRGHDHRYLPVHSVSYQQAEGFCEAQGGALPGIFEWELMARGLDDDDSQYGKDGVKCHGQASYEDFEGCPYPWGLRWQATKTITAERAPSMSTICSSGDRTDTKPAICDMGGNLQEWVDHANPWDLQCATRRRDPEEDPRLKCYFIKGASWADPGEVQSLAFVIQNSLPEDESDNQTGFRCMYRKAPTQDVVWEGVQSDDEEKTTRVVRGYGGIHPLGGSNDPLFKRFQERRLPAAYLLDTPDAIPRVGGFFIDATKVTNDDYKAFIQITDGGHGPWDRHIGTGRTYDYTVPESGKGDDPIQGVSWRDAYGYCSWRDKRLPTADEWERIVRGTGLAMRPLGDVPLAGPDAPEGGTIEPFDLFCGDPVDDSHRLIRNMWSQGFEWTNTADRSARGETRVLKGRLDAVDGCSKDDYEQFLTVIRIPAALDRKVPSATIRCAQDHEPAFFERLGMPSLRTSNPVSWPPGDAGDVGDGACHNSP